MSYIEDIINFNPTTIVRKEAKDPIFGNGSIEVKEYLDTTFFCDYNKIIHSNKKQALLCRHCCPDNDVEEFRSKYNLKKDWVGIVKMITNKTRLEDFNAGK